MSTHDPGILFTHSPVATLVLSREGQIADANPESFRVLAEQRSNLLGSPVLAVVMEEDRVRARENFMTVLSGRSRDWSSRVRRGDGVHRAMHLKAVPLKGAESEVRGVLLFLMDVTQDQAGRPERNQMQGLLENLPGQFLLTLDDSGRMRYASGISRTHYRSEVDAVGEPYRELLEAGQENLVRTKAMLKALAAGADWAGTHWHTRVDGTAFPVRVFASPYRDPRSGSIIGGLVAGRDVSVEYDLRHRVEHAERLATLGQMVGEVGERIGGVARSLLKDVTPLLASANGTGERISQSLDGLDDWSRAILDMSADVSLDRRPTSSEEMVDRVLEKRSTRMTELGVQLIREGECERAVSVDPQRSAKALGALVDNALDALATKPNDRRLHVAIQPGQDGLIIRVRDNGPGIIPEDEKQIYHAFFTTRASRPGLGLTRARDQIRSQGGRIWHTSNEGGATFAIELPWEAPEASFPFRPVPLTLNRQRSILVVDDEDAVRTGIRKFLEKVGYDVREAWSGRSALAQLTAGQPPELVLTDLKMSDGSGYWFLDQLARDFPNLLERTLVITGDTEHAEVAALAQRTGVPVLRKPLELPELLERLDEVSRV